jgi:hypothetical protein
MSEQQSPKQKGLVNTLGETLYGTDQWSSISRKDQPPILPMKVVPRPPKPVTLVIVALVALTLFGMTLWNHDQINGITWAILTLAGTTVWGCLYMARR